MAKFEQVLAVQKLGLLLFQMSGRASHSLNVQVTKGNVLVLVQLDTFEIIKYKVASVLNLVGIVTSCFRSGDLSLLKTPEIRNFRFDPYFAHKI